MKSNRSADGPLRFPDPRDATEDGLLCIGGDLRVATLLRAYEIGIFPWPQEGYPLLWFSPPRRGVLDFSQLHISQSMRKLMKRAQSDQDLRFFWNRDFAKVIHSCASVPRPHERGTWILPEVERAYHRFHQAGYAHSLEAWRGTELVGGLYGVYVAGVFSAESMFYRESNASKLCLFKCIRFLHAHGITWMDTQMITPVVEGFGGRYIDREEFLQRHQMARGSATPIEFRGEVSAWD